jgi:hypothetical protein
MTGANWFRGWFDRSQELVGWFDRSKEEYSGIPRLVTREHANNARLYLREHSGFDFESFERAISVEKMLNEPLGETAECLSAEDIAKLIGSDVSRLSAVFDADLVARAVNHSAICETCFNNMALYEDLKNTSLDRAVVEKVQGLTPSLTIGSVGLLEVAPSGNRCLGLELTMRCDASDFDAMDTVQAQIVGPFDTKDVVLHRVGPWNKRILDKDAHLNPTKRSSAPLFYCHYRTDSLVGLDQVSNPTCSFVSISQEISGKEVLSRRVIRVLQDRDQGIEPGSLGICS